ncbi:response regulator [Mucilaginibacter sp.]|uniref:response regulator n=1 Tax=Mucilaginibacter sp. TaxID=1882438 RepID=UPI003D1255B3
MLRFSFRQQVLAGFAVSVILVLIVGILSYKSINQLESDSNMVEHTQKVIKTSTNLLQLMIDAETGMRGYVATNKDVFLDPYKSALPGIKKDIEQLRGLIPDNPIQVKRVDSLSALVNAQLNILKTNIEVRPIRGLDFMVQNNMLINGKQNMDNIRELIDHLKQTENDLLAIRKASSAAASSRALDTILVGSIVFLVIIVILFFYIQGTFERQKKTEAEVKFANIELEKVLAENRAKNWLLTGTSALNEKMQGQQSERELAGNVLTEICKYSQALTGTFYLFNEDEESLELYASYAFSDLKTLKQTVKLSEGWLGQVAKDEKAALIKGKLNDKLALGSSLIQQEIVDSFIVPFFFDKKLKGVIEIAFNNDLAQSSNDYILAVANDIGIAVNTAQARTIMHELLSQVQQQAEELEAQQEEMRVTNEELMSKTEMLQASEEEMRVQQEELRTTNAELEEKASLLEEKNQAIEEARKSINVKVKELETTGKYKSEFLANMSHELRTPLNSILVLARILKDNKPLNLSEDQVKYASVIFNAGNDLLTLINDILDLSKIESGKLEMQNENVKISNILHDMEMLFTEVARNKKIKYTITTNNNLPKQIFTDKVRVEQILKNLLSNAFKFTPENGAIEINVIPGEEPKTVSFCIKDTGIGIPLDKQKLIFEAFQQADGSTSRRYGGTGLGLSISRELVILLGGKITLSSEPGKGSEFTLTIPLQAENVTNEQETLPTVEDFVPELQFLKPAVQIAKKSDKEPLVVIVEDDKNFADILHDYSRDHGYKSIMVYEGTNAVQLIKENQPDAVILDIMLPGKDGWQILKELKQDVATMHIPVHLMSAGEAAANRVRREGAISFLKKPIDTGTLDKLFGDIMLQSGTKFKQILLVEDNQTQSQALNDLMQSQGITVDQAFDGASAFRMLHENEYQCVILDLNLPDISGLDFLDKIKEIDRFKALPVIINTAMELDKTSVSRLMHYANAMVVKTTKSADRLIDEVNLFLNKVRESADQPADLSAITKNKVTSHGKDVIKGKKVLIVDDDMRNIFALSSALQGYDMVVEIANDGQEAIDKLEAIKDIDMVLMDIMMPVMDGYEATRYIRKQNKWAKLPVIALTAKAMMDDREKCIAAGANDYITKPVDIDRLISLMQLWLTS